MASNPMKTHARRSPCTMTAIAVCIALGVFPEARADHDGPKYAQIPSGCKSDPSSATRDCTDGDTITWYDRLNKKHTVKLKSGESVTVIFPIARGGSWLWMDNDNERTGFDRNTDWVQAQIRFNGGDLEIRSVGFISGNPAGSPLLEVLKSAKEHADKLMDIAKSGAATLEEVKAIAVAAGLL